MNIIKAVNLVFDYIRRDEEGQVEEVKRALDHVNLEIEKGSFVAILGHNGSGKSTFAKQINGILSPTDGTLFVSEMDTRDEAHLWDIRKNAGMVFQNPDNQIVATVVEEDVAFGLENNGVPPEPNKFANAVTISKIGNVTPTPVSARLPSPGICSMYMRSTML